MKPEAVLAIKIKRSAKAEQAFQTITSYFPRPPSPKNDGLRYINFPSLRSVFVNPTMTLTKDFLLAGVDMDDVQRAVKAERKDTTLDKSTAFASRLPAYNTANQGLWLHQQQANLRARLIPWCGKWRFSALPLCPVPATCLTLEASPDRHRGQAPPAHSVFPDAPAQWLPRRFQRPNHHESSRDRRRHRRWRAFPSPV